MVRFQGNFGNTRITVPSIVLFIWIAHACIGVFIYKFMIQD
jgi:hypothetical protein